MIGETRRLDDAREVRNNNNRDTIQNVSAAILSHTGVKPKRDERILLESSKSINNKIN